MQKRCILKEAIGAILGIALAASMFVLLGVLPVDAVSPNALFIESSPEPMYLLAFFTIVLTALLSARTYLDRLVSRIIGQ